MTLATQFAAHMIRALPRRRLSQLVGQLCDTEVPEPVGRVARAVYARAYGVNLSEAVEPPGGFRSFDDFFTRELKSGARPIAANPLVAPADGVIRAAGQLSSVGCLAVKGHDYSLAELLGSEAEAQHFASGAFAVIYLSPRDYHRVHAPAAGKITQVRAISGERYPVNAIGERHVPNLLARNERVAITLETERLGRLAVVLVGAIVVGRISVSALADRPATGLHRFDSPPSVDKGSELGVFHLGSTVVLVVDRSAGLSPRVGRIRFGESLQSS